MNRQLLTLALITTLCGSAFAGNNTGENDKNKTSNIVIVELPVLMAEDLDEISAQLELHTVPGTMDITPNTYQVYDTNDELIMEETVQFENTPSGDMKVLIRKGEFLMEKGDIQIYKVF
ncbi:MAG: hypothetical protein RIC80_01050 [Cyclobacteriaceae bacterium]